MFGGGLRTFTAKFPGICEECQEPFEAGDEVAYNAANFLVHGDPDDCQAQRPRTTTLPCSKCFLVHAGECF